MAKKDFYQVLGVSRDATEAQIKSAYRKLARKLHPDVNKAADATAKFREATEAYEVLSDQAKRKQYDQFGHAGPGPFGGQGGRPGPGGGYQQRSWGPGGAQGGINFEDLFGGGQGFAGMGLDEILETLGGRAAGGRQARGRGRPAHRGQDVESHLDMDFMQAAKGVTTTLRLQDESGQIQTINVHIPPGVKEGSRVRVQGKGGPGPGGQGDLFIITHIRPHPFFRREDNDIYVEVPISITESVLGGKVDVPTLEGTMTLTVPPGSSSGRKLRLKGKGISMPSGQSGDQYVVLKVVAPQSVSERAAELLKEFGKIEPYDPRKDVPWR